MPFEDEMWECLKPFQHRFYNIKFSLKKLRYLSAVREAAKNEYIVKCECLKFNWLLLANNPWIQGLFAIKFGKH